MLAAFVSQYSSAEDLTELKLTNCVERVVTSLPVSGTDTSGSALYYPESKMQMFNGCRITSLRISFNSASAEGGVRIFITHDLNGTPEYEQTCTAKSGWNTFTLDTPYELDGTAIYIGYEVTGARYLSYSNTFVKGEEWVWRRAEGWVLYEDIYSATMVAYVQGDNLPKYDVSIGDVVMPGYTTTGTPVTYTGGFYNLGASTVEEITLAYKVDGVVAQTERISVGSVANRTYGTFEASGFSLSEEGNPEVTLEITEVNGNADLNLTDNSTRTKKLLCRDSFTPRKILMEVFSTELCTNCPAAHRTIEAQLGDKTDIIEIGHHAGYLTDYLTVDASLEYEWFYEPDMLYAPAFMFDRTSFADNYPSVYNYDSPLTDVNASVLDAFYAEASAAPAFVTVNISKEYDETTRHLKLTVDGNQLLPVDNIDSLRLYVFLKEDSIFSETQRGSSGSFYHRNSLKECLTDVWGDKIDVANGFTATYETDIADTCNVKQMYAVAFVANYDSEDRFNCNVLNSNEVRIVDGSSTGIVSVSGDSAPLLRLADGNILLSGEVDKIYVYDISGRLVDTKNITGQSSLSLEQLTSGTYIVKASGSGHSQSIKFVK
ncbi:MAG: Omp28-related outer membrane protein [Prevotellaceae bacterium]|nr:Omp28-related outer membrane protein [Prevotellaceae bacterium]